MKKRLVVTITTFKMRGMVVSVVMQLPEYGCQFSCKKKIRKPAAQREVEWVAVYQAPAANC